MLAVWRSSSGREEMGKRADCASMLRIMCAPTAAPDALSKTLTALFISENAIFALVSHTVISASVGGGEGCVWRGGRSEREF
jgi:hypothetical protein